MRLFSIAALAAVAIVFPFGTSAAASLPSVIYEIYPRSFQDTNGDGIGDLDGVTLRLDYIQGLGADMIWLMPIFKSPSTHGYDVSDYDSIESAYGDLPSFTRLISEAHARNIKVILDLPVNSTAKSHPWFQTSAQDVYGPAGKLYLWKNQPQSWPGIQWAEDRGHFYLSSFSSEMPDLNWRSEEVYKRVRDVFLKWTELGVDGFRLDAAKHLVKGPHGETNQPETHAVWRRLAKDVRAANPSTYFVGEVWDSSQTIASYYGKGDELDACFDFPTMYGLRSSLRENRPDALFYSLQLRQASMPNDAYGSMFIGNHDTWRIATELGGDVDKLKLSALITLTMPGTATLYYGDELGVRNGELQEHQGDLAKRTPMPWGDESLSTVAAPPWIPFSVSAGTVAGQSTDPQSLLSTYRVLGQLRAKSAALHSGHLESLARPGAGLLSYVRKTAAGETALVVVNFADQPSAAFTTSAPATAANIAYGAASISSGPAGLTIGALAPKSGLIITF